MTWSAFLRAWRRRVSSSRLSKNSIGASACSISDASKSLGMSHVREARMLCRKTVDLFTLLSQSGETGHSERMGMTQDLLSLVTGLAHYLKILIRIALTGALRLDREFGRGDALGSFLDKLTLLASGGGNPAARRVYSKGAKTIEGPKDDAMRSPGTQGVSYGYKSLAPENAGESPFIGRTSSSNSVAQMNPPSDLCLVCRKTVEEDCVRLGTYQRWHSHCVTCVTCGRAAGEPAQSSKEKEKERERLKEKENAADGTVATIPPSSSSSRRPPPKVAEFLFVTEAKTEDEVEKTLPKAICCVDHPLPRSRAGFAAVSRLEQFAFLLNVALRRLYILLLKRNMMPLASSVPQNLASITPGSSGATNGSSRGSPGSVSTATPGSGDDIMRMKSVHLDRKLSATARLPKRSMIVESPSGKIAQPSDVMHGQPAPPPPLQQRQTSGSSQSQSTPKKLTKPPPHTNNGTPSQQQQQWYGPQQSEPQALPPSQTILRPPFARNNTQVAIVDEVRPGDEYHEDAMNGGGQTPTPRGSLGPSSYGDRRESNAGYSNRTHPNSSNFEDDSLTLGDIPQLLESEQAREQHRSLPRQENQTAIADLSALELFIVKHFAVLALLRSPLKDQFDLDEILELVEARKATFWGKFFKGNNDKKNIKKKGTH